MTYRRIGKREFAFSLSRTDRTTAKQALNLGSASASISADGKGSTPCLQGLSLRKENGCRKWQRRRRRGWSRERPAPQAKPSVMSLCDSRALKETPSESLKELFSTPREIVFE